MPELFLKSLTVIKQKGIFQFLKKTLEYVHFKTLGQIDLFLFKKHKWSVIQLWMFNKLFYYVLSLLALKEGEHQIGRFISLNKIFKEIKNRGLSGDIIEFGSYQGFSLYWLSKFRDKYGLKARIIGIDSFEGLPETSTVWQKGKFNDTSFEQAVLNVTKALAIAKLEDKNNIILKGLFNDQNIISSVKKNCKKAVLVHIDCDLGSSSDHALKLIDTLELSDTWFLLFDDWGCHPDEIPESFDRYYDSCKYLYSIEQYLRTDMTNYFIVNRKP